MYLVTIYVKRSVPTEYMKNLIDYKYVVYDLDDVGRTFEYYVEVPCMNHKLRKENLMSMQRKLESENRKY